MRPGLPDVEGEPSQQPVDLAPPVAARAAEPIPESFGDGPTLALSSALADDELEPVAASRADRDVLSPARADSSEIPALVPVAAVRAAEPIPEWLQREGAFPEVPAVAEPSTGRAAEPIPEWLQLEGGEGPDPLLFSADGPPSVEVATGVAGLGADSSERRPDPPRASAELAGPTTERLATAAPPALPPASLPELEAAPAAVAVADPCPPGSSGEEPQLDSGADSEPDDESWEELVPEEEPPVERWSPPRASTLPPPPPLLRTSTLPPPPPVHGSDLDALLVEANRLPEAVMPSGLHRVGDLLASGPGPDAGRFGAPVTVVTSPPGPGDHTGVGGPVGAVGGPPLLPGVGLEQGYLLADLVAGMFEPADGEAPRGRPAVLESGPLHDGETLVVASDTMLLDPVADGETRIVAFSSQGGAGPHSGLLIDEQPTQMIDTQSGSASPSAGLSLEVAAALPLPPLPVQVKEADTVVLDVPQRDGRGMATGPFPAVVPTGGFGTSGSGSFGTGGFGTAGGGNGGALVGPLRPLPASPPLLPAGGDDPLVGTLIDGQYQVIRRIGVGGMGAVYLAEQVDMARLVALKVVAPQPGDHGELERRFRREAQAASKLNHPNIVTLYNFGRLPSGTLFIAMEYIEGVSLAQVMKQEGSLAVLRALDIAIQVSEGLQEAHAKGVVHRDLKPDNILIQARRGGETAKVLDFGIAKLLDPNESPTDVTRAGLVRGTPIYMSPEQARGDLIDHRSDIYSLGVILYSLLTGQLPIRADSPFGYLHAHQHQRPTPLRQVRPDLGLSVALENLVMGCLMKHPAQRPQSMAELEAGLRLIRAEVLGVTPDPAWRPVAVDLGRRRPNKLLIGGGIAGAVLVVLGLLGWQAGRTVSPAVPPAGGPVSSGPTASSAAPVVPAVAKDEAPRVVESSAPRRPDWTEELSLQMGDEHVAVGSSGPAPNVEAAVGWAQLAATDQLAHDLVDELGQPGLALTIRGLTGNRRGTLDSRYTLEVRRLLAGGPDPAAEALYAELRAGQQEVAGRLEVVLGEVGRDMAVPRPDTYWEKYRFTRQGQPGEFYRAWARRTLPPRVTHRVVAAFTASTRLLGMAAVEPYPTIAWGMPEPQGALVYSVAEGSVAAQSNILPGDLISAIETQPVTNRAGLGRLLRAPAALAQQSGGAIRVAVRRVGQGRLELQLKVPRPATSSRGPSVAGSTSGGGIDE